MEFVGDLWLAIVLAAVAVFLVSSVVHMALGIHNKDYDGLPDEDGTLEALRGHGVTPGNYVFPHCKTMKEWSSPETLAKIEQGPVGFMIVRKDFGMGASLVQWFLFSLVVGVCVAYVADIALAPGAAFGAVMQVTGAVAFFIYGFANVPDSIWKGVKWSTTFKFVFDGLLYGLATGAVFAWMWPAAAAAP